MRRVQKIAAGVFIVCLVAISNEARADDWTFAVATPGDPFDHPPLRALPLLHTKPDDVKEMVPYRGARQRYAQIRYGSPGSVRITVVLDEVSANDVDLYVDANRNRRIEASDRLDRDGRTWRTPLSVAVVEGETTSLTPRAAIFRLGTTGVTFSFAALGYLEGTLSLHGKKHAARRTDGDGNGFFTDRDDRLWIDLNDDGRWDSSDEQFLYSTILIVGSSRYALRSDLLGTRLAALPVEGTGTVRLKLDRPAGAPRASEMHATLLGRDGSAVGLSGESEGATVPVGEYRLGTFTLAFLDAGGGPRWSFIFSDDGGTHDFKWYRGEKNGTVDIDPVGKLVLETGVAERSKSISAGNDIELQPKLYTGGGLLINTCFRGSPTTPGGNEGQGALIKLKGDSGSQVLGVARSGFA